MVMFNVDLYAWLIHTPVHLNFTLAQREHLKASV